MQEMLFRTMADVKLKCTDANRKAIDALRSCTRAMRTMPKDITA